MKDKAQRRADDERVIKKRLKLVKATNSPNLRFPDGKTIYEKQLEKPGVLNKRHPFDCGKADCVMCHAEKVKPKGNIKRKQKQIKEVVEDYGPEDFVWI